jgi:hypothetical protein
MILSKFGAFTPAKNFFANLFDRRNGVAALTPLLYTNELVDHINALLSNTTLNFTYRITETLGVPALALAKMTGAQSAGCTCAGCSGIENPACGGCSPINTSSFYKCGSTSATLSRTAPGVYELILAPDFAYNNVVVTFGNIGYTGGIINVVRTSNVLYTIRVIDTATGIAVDGELTNTPLIISFWQ